MTEKELQDMLEMGAGAPLKPDDAKRPPKAVQTIGRKWTDVDYECRGITRRHATAKVTANVTPEIRDRIIAMARGSRVSISQLITTLVESADA